MTNSNDDFDNPDFEPDAAGDVDFSDLEDEKKSASLGALWSTPIVKFGLIGAGLVVIVAVFMLFGGESEKVLMSGVKGGKEDVKQAPGTQEVTQTMKTALEEQNKRDLENATLSGKSNIPVPIAPPKVLMDVPTEEATGEDPLIRWKKMQEERIRMQREQQVAEEKKGTAVQGDPKRDQARQALADAMMNYMKTILKTASEKPELQHFSIVSLEELAKVQQDKAKAAVGSVDMSDSGFSQSSVAKAPAENIIISAGSIQYAQMLNEANSDIPGPVLAMIVTGPFSGSRLMGSFQPTDEYLIIQFNSLITKKGTSIPIKAFAIDPDTSLTALASDVDHRYLERIVLPAAASFVEGLGSGYAETTTTVTGSGDSATSSTTDLNTKQEFGKAIEEAASTVSDVLKEDGSKAKTLVRVFAGTPMGILFMAPVTDKGILMARQGYNPEAEAQKSAQQMMLMQGSGNGNNSAASQLQQLQQGLLNQQTMLQPSSAQAGAPQ